MLLASPCRKQIATKKRLSAKFGTRNRGVIAMMRKVILEGSTTYRMMSHWLGQHPFDAQYPVGMNTNPMANASPKLWQLQLL
jgi:hypothetical protein